MSFKGKRPSIMFPLFMVIKHRFNEHFMVDPPSLRGHQPLCQRVGSPLNKHRWFWWQKCWDCSPNKKLGMFNQEKRDLTYLIWSNHDTNRKNNERKWGLAEHRKRDLTKDNRDIQWELWPFQTSTSTLQMDPKRTLLIGDFTLLLFFLLFSWPLKWCYINRGLIVWFNRF